MIFSSFRNNQRPRNTTATLAFHQFRLAQDQQGEDSIRVVVERIEEKHRARLYIDGAKGFSIHGPERESRPEAICDGVELGKSFDNDGQDGARRASVRLAKKQWTPREIACADEEEPLESPVGQRQPANAQ